MTHAALAALEHTKEIDMFIIAMTKGT
jgi:hypothetical protein